MWDYLPASAGFDGSWDDEPKAKTPSDEPEFVLCVDCQRKRFGRICYLCLSKRADWAAKLPIEQIIRIGHWVGVGRWEGESDSQYGARIVEGFLEQVRPERMACPWD